MIDKDLKIKANLFQKLRNNNIINAKQIINITYEQGKRLKLTREEDKMLTELCYHLTEKRNNGFYSDTYCPLCIGPRYDMLYEDYKELNGIKKFL